MADLSDILSNISGQSSSVEQLTEALKELSKASQDAFAAGDPKLLMNIKNMEAAVKRLMKAQEDHLKVEEELRNAYDASIASGEKQVELTEEQVKSYNSAVEEYDKASKVFVEAEAAKVKALEKTAKEQREHEAALIRHARENTLLGKAYGALTGSLAKFTAGLTGAAMATKVYNRYMEAAEIRQKIIIQNFRGLNKFAGETTDGFLDAAAQTSKLTEALAMVEGTAVRLGVSTEYAAEAMVRFSRIAGTDSPEKLQVLSQGAIATSRALGITVPEAIDFVATRMDKFGGTAASAVIALNEIREDSERMNKALGMTAIRGDDIVRVLTDISRQSNIYAIDQRLVGSVLRDNIARLMATGESYEMARRKAEAFTKGVTGDAPEWMQVLAGEEILGGMIQAFGKGGEKGTAAFMEKYGDALDRAKPGLSKKVLGIMEDTTMGAYEKSRLIQELTAGTEVGIEAMNDQILALSENTGVSIEVLAKQMGVSREVAHGMIESARAMRDERAQVERLTGASVETLMEEFKINKAQAEILQGNKQLIQERLAFQKEEELVAAKLEADREKEQRLLEQKEKVEGRIARLKALKASSPGADAKQLEVWDNMLKKAENELAQYETKLSEKEQREGKEEVGIATVANINKDILTKMGDYSDSTLKSLRGWFTEQATLMNLIYTGIAVGMGGALFKLTGLSGKIWKFLGTASRGGGPLDFGGHSKRLGSKLAKKLDKIPGSFGRLFKRFTGVFKKETNANTDESEATLKKEITKQTSHFSKDINKQTRTLTRAIHKSGSKAGQMAEEGFEHRSDERDRKRKGKKQQTKKRRTKSKSRLGKMFDRAQSKKKAKRSSRGRGRNLKKLGLMGLIAAGGSMLMGAGDLFASEKPEEPTTPEGQEGDQTQDQAQQVTPASQAQAMAQQETPPEEKTDAPARGTMAQSMIEKTSPMTEMLAAGGSMAAQAGMESFFQRRQEQMIDQDEQTQKGMEKKKKSIFASLFAPSDDDKPDRKDRKPSPRKKKGFLGNLFDKGKKMIGGGMVGAVGGLAMKIVSVLLELPSLIGDVLSGKFTSAIATLAELIVSGLGAVLGSFLGPIGTIAGGMAGAELGTHLGDMIRGQEKSIDGKLAAYFADKDKSAPKIEVVKETRVVDKEGNVKNINLRSDTLSAEQFAKYTEDQKNIFEKMSKEQKEALVDVKAEDLERPTRRLDTIINDLNQADSRRAAEEKDKPTNNLLAQAAMVTPSVLDIKDAQSMTEEQRRSQGILDPSTVVDVNEVQQQNQAQAANESPMLSGAFQGGIQGDGSVILRVDNFMSVYADARKKSRRGIRNTR